MGVDGECVRRVYMVSVSGECIWYVRRVYMVSESGGCIWSVSQAGVYGK